MATWIVSGIVALCAIAAICKMIRDRKNGKGCCACGGDCSRCGKCR